MNTPTVEEIAKFAIISKTVLPSYDNAGVASWAMGVVYKEHSLIDIVLNEVGLMLQFLTIALGGIKEKGGESTSNLMEYMLRLAIIASIETQENN